MATGAASLGQYHDLLPQAERLFGSDSGTTGAPLRSLLILLAATVLVLIGVVLVVMGLVWLRRIRLPEEGPAAIDRDEVIATLKTRQLLAYADGPSPPYWPLRRWLADDLVEMPWWQREIMSRGVRAFVRCCAFAIVLAICCLALPRIMTDDLVGPFPLAFVIMLPFVTAVWAALGLMLIGSGGPRLESEELPLPPDATRSQDQQGQQIIESRPGGLDRESLALALTLGAAGLAVQCLMLMWWNLSPIDYPLRATTILRHAGSIAGGIVFFLVGGRMVAAASELLLVFRYESMLILIDASNHGMIARAAAVRTESLGLTGPRHVVAAVGGADVRESAQAMIQDRLGKR